MTRKLDDNSSVDGGRNAGDGNHGNQLENADTPTEIRDDIPCQASMKGNTVPPLPYDGIRIAEKSNLLSGRLIGQMFADQGAHVFIERDAGRGSTTLDDYFDRNEAVVLAYGELADDGDEGPERSRGSLHRHRTDATP